MKSIEKTKSSLTHGIVCENCIIIAPEIVSKNRVGADLEITTEI